jgi:hypothetical protein
MTNTINSIQLKSGYILLDASSATGGVSYQRTVLDEQRTNNGEGTEKTWKTVKVVDHDEAVRNVDRQAKKADYILRKHCSRFGRFWFADEDQLALVMADVAELRKAAKLANTEAAAVGCARRAYVSIVPTKIDLAHEEAAREVAHTIQGTLADMLAVINAGDIGRPFEAVYLRMKNLEKLAVGICSESIVFARDEAKAAKKVIRDWIKQGQTPESAAKHAETDMIQAAIDMFAPLDG